MRSSTINRKTNETDIVLTLELEGVGTADVNSGCGFFNHMLELFASHGRFNLSVKCVGDTDVDYHHTVEDIGIVLGTAFKEALGDKRGITRYGSMILPMDEALIMVALDFSGRSYLNYNVALYTPKVGEFDTQLAEEFLLAFVRAAGVTLHVEQLEGTNTHHILEGVFKALARALKQAVAIDPQFKNEIPSTKGAL